MTSPPRHLASLLVLALAATTSACSERAPAAGDSATPGLPSQVADLTVAALPDGLATDAGATDALDVSEADLDAPDATAAETDTGLASDTAGDVATSDAIACSDDATCEDGNPCNGLATCQGGFCVAGAPPADQTGICFADGSAGVCVGGGVTDRTTCAAGCNTATGACVENRTLRFGSNGGDAGGCEDTSFDDDTPNRNDNGGVDANGHRLTTDSFVWLRFDLSALPAGATVTGARLDLYSAWTDPGSGGARPTVVNLGATTVPATQWRDDMATWNTWDGTNPWTGGQDGGTADRGAELARLDVDPNPVDLYLEFPLAPAAATAVEDAAGSGEVVLNVWGAGGGHDRQYIACEGADGRRPVLRVDYTW